MPMESLMPRTILVNQEAKSEGIQGIINLDDGRTVYYWSKATYFEDPGGLFAKVLSPDGKQIGSTIDLLKVSDADEVPIPVGVSASLNGITVAFKRIDATANLANEVLLQVVTTSFDNKRISSKDVLIEQGIGPISFSSLGADGILVTKATKQTLVDGYTSYTEYQAGILKSDASFSGYTITANGFDQYIPHRASDSNLAKLSDGNYVLVNLVGETVYARIFDANGLEVRSTFALPDFQIGEASKIVVASLSGGRFAVAWQEYLSYPQKILMQVFDKNGKAVGKPKNLIESEQSWSFQSLDDGRLLVGYQDEYLFYHRLYDEYGRTSSLELEDEINALATQNTSGNLVFLNGDGQKPTHYTVYNPRSFIGTKSPEKWIGGSLADKIKGNAGNDQLLGNGGDDEIFGGADNDTLSGGTGKDYVDGGKGIDIAVYKDETKGAIIALDGSRANSGAAFGDKLVAIENLSGSNIGSDWLGGNNGSNTLDGNNGDDKLYGRGDADKLNGGKGADKLYGEAGNDTLNGGEGRDTIDGGTGIDTVSFYSEEEIRVDLNSVATKGPRANTGIAKGDIYISIENLIGTKIGSDELTGNKASNSIWGYGGDDFIRTMQGNDSAYGGAGDDVLHGGAGSDLLDGGSGQDFVAYYYDGPVTASLDGSLKATGAARGDKYVSIDDLGGSDKGSDTLAGNGGRNFIFGNAGDDKIYGRDGSDILDGGKGADTLDGGANDFDYAQYFHGGAVNISLDGSLTATGDAAGDKLISIECLIGSGTGGDQLVGNSGDNLIYGEGGNDSIKTKDGFDSLYGGDGNDRLFGGDNNDYLEGGLGKDILEGGSDFDRFYYSNANEGGDTITDFSANEKIVINLSGFIEELGAAIETNEFRIRTDNVAQDRNDYLIFRTTDHSLWFDADANGKGASKMLCFFENSFSLKYSDIEIFFPT
jgi:Ca2+-binding RTX toxin-like protein